uniref:Tachykinin-3-like n=1 Tax=Takifugu rubripes TaxID=31033 RepID=A0A3B5JWI6_TAKRU
MRRGLLLVTLFLLMKLRCSQSRCEETGSRSSTSDQTVGLDSVKRNILKRYSDLDYDSFVGLMGRRNASEISFLMALRELHDIFVGLMGRRNSESDNGPWRREYAERRGVFLNKCRLRFLQGL